MTFSFQNWLQAVWFSITEPAQAAQNVLRLNLPVQVLWTALALAAVLNVILLAVLQLFSPAPEALEAGAFVLTPFSYAGVVGAFLVLFVFGTQSMGRFLGGIGSQPATLAIIVWFQAVSLTLEVGQLVLLLVSPVIGSLYGLVSLGLLAWVFVNFVNVLHGFDNLAKSMLTVVLSLIVTALGAGLVLAMFGIGRAGGMP